MHKTTGIPITVGASSNLFAVCTDVGLTDALQEASDALDAAISIVMSEAADSRTAKLLGGVTLMQIAKGVVDAAIVSAEHSEVAHA